MSKRVLSLAIMVLSASALASDVSQLEISLTFDAEVESSCEIQSPVQFNFGTLDLEGVYQAESDLVFTCTDDLDFAVHFETSPTTVGEEGNLYEDEFVAVFAGSKTGYSSDGTLFARGNNTTAHSLACNKGSSSNYQTSATNVAGIPLYTLGGIKKNNYQTKSICLLPNTRPDDGLYSITLTSIVQLKKLPEEDLLGSLPTNFMVPMSILARPVE